MKYIDQFFIFIKNMVLTLFIMFPQVMNIFVNATITGTILCLIYPNIHALFPSAVEHGIIPIHLGWWNSVCIVWIFSILFKSTNTTVNNTNLPKNEN